MKTRLLLPTLICAVSLALCGVQAGAANPAKHISAKKFDSLADAALAAMKKRAAELKTTGVAVVSFAEGDSVQGWNSKMAVVGKMKDVPSDTSKGNNLVGIAYAKSAEMADTLKDSGTAGRPPMTGEFGWQGGVTARTRNGNIIVAFSGGKSEDDVEVSKAGLAVLKAGL
jgi:hypothetical protein